jgi:MFS family permease
MGASFIDRLGGALLFPFFALYITFRFDVTMTEVGVLFAIFSVTGIIGSFLGGALTDRFGRRAMILFGLIVSATSTLIMGLITDLRVFYIAAALVGLLSDAGGPAQQAMVADLLPKEKLAEGYGIWRVLANLAVTFGPLIGGFIASRSYLALFIIDAITSLITAAIVIAVIPETRPPTAEGQEEESFIQTVRGYSQVLRDRVYMAFIIISIVVFTVYIQMNTTMPVYLRDVQSIPPSGYGYILSLNAAMVVLFQFWITRRLAGRAPMRMMALGALLYAVGFGLFGVNAGLLFYAFAMAIITIGEMVIVPVSQALAARFAPSHMRGRYLAMFGFSYAIPFAVGPLLAGLVMDNFDPRWVWWGGGILGGIGVFAYLALHLRVGRKLGLMDEGGETSALPDIATAATEP